MTGWEAMKRQVWERDQGLCQGCGKNLLVIERISEKLRAAHAALKFVPVYRWEAHCYFCKRPTPVVTYSFLLDYDYCIGGVPKLDVLLMEDYSWVRPAFSNSQGATVVCNTCTHCGKIAMGNHYVGEALVDFAMAGELERLKVGAIPNVTAPTDFPELREDHVLVHRSAEGRVHRLNENDDLPSNSVLLCRRCDAAWRRQKHNAGS